LGASAQQNYFTDVAESAVKKTDQKRVIIPDKFRTVQLDTAGLLPFLHLLPAEKDILYDRNNTPVLLIPMPNGTMAKFHVWESSVMAPELAAAYPELRTFTGQGIDDPTATIKLDWTEFGFHAMILSPISGSVFIDPYDQKTVNNYISYYKADFKKKEKFTELPPIKFPKNAGAKTSPGNIAAGSCVGTQLRTYRLAVACTGEYAVAATGLASPTKAQTLAKIVVTVNRVNGVYEKEVAIRMVLIANDTAIIFTVGGASDPFTDNDPNALISESQTQITNRIGNANFDIGHTFSTGGGGLAGLGVVCVTGQKASGITGSTNPVGDAYDIDYVAHEMGHQFGGEHTFNSELGYCSGNRSTTANAEPGSGSTIMAYAGICDTEDLQLHSDPQFHAISFDQITQYSIFSSGNNCAVTTATGNTAPVVNAGPAYIIPISTPFVLTGSATDADGDALTYSWEQVDVGGPNTPWNAPTGNAPLFRSFTPVTTPVRYFPKLANQIANSTTIGEILPSYARTMHFRLTARDNKAAGGGVCYAQTTVTTAATASASPFTVTYPNASGITWNVNEFQTITWDPAGTAAAPISCANVTIQLSTDGGNTFPVTILASTPNDGTEEIQVPNNVSATVRIRVMAVGNLFYDFSNANLRIQTSPTATFAFSNPASVAVCSASSGTATLKSAALAGFATSNAIALSASLNPAGTTVSFGTTSLTPGNSTTVTLNNTNSLAPGTYTVRVTGVAASITKTRDILFVVGTGGAAPASLTQPANDAIGQTALPSFNWTSVPGAISYTLEISSTIDFAAVVQTVSGITTLPVVLTIPLAENTAYYWRVKTTNICGTGSVSVTPNRFKTGLSSCKKSTDVPKAISATGTPTVTSTIIIPASAGLVITDLNVIGLKGDHSYVSDLTFTLTSPNNTSVVILDGPCDGYADFDLNLDDQAGTAFTCPPTGGQNSTPQNPLSVFNGQNSTGTWTLRVKDNFAQDGGNLTGWGLNFNSNTTSNCVITSTPLATTYTFTGTGNWNLASNWSSGIIPPSPLPANSAIIINHAVGGQCVLNVTQQIAAGASLTVMTGKNLVVPGVLTIQ
jgi:subtilisin-like proprotein convertase family protein